MTGLSIAWHLLSQGAIVTIVERTGVAAGPSGVQPGGVRQRRWSTRVNCLLARESVAFYNDVADRLEAVAGPVSSRAATCSSPDALAASKRT